MPGKLRQRCRALKHVRALLIAVGLICLALPALAKCDPDHISLRGDWGEARFAIELADTPESRMQGLMFREEMAAGAGMLFVYDQPQTAQFWMKNTLIPLDMIFVDQSGVVTHIHRNAIPGDLTPIDGGDSVFAVLEINGGLAKTYGVTTGTQVQHPVFSDGPAVWSC